MRLLGWTVKCAATFQLSFERMVSLLIGQCRHVTTVQETTVHTKENNRRYHRRCTHAQQLRRDPSTSALDLSRHGSWLDSPQTHAWNTLISSDQQKMSRAFQMLTRCEL